MNKLTKNLITGTVALLMTLSLGAVSGNAHASVNPDNYGVDVFPSKKTHNKFAYQLRKRGHNSRIYYTSTKSKIGKAIFNKHGVPNIDYSNYMARHEPKLFKAINKKLDSSKKSSNKRIKRNRKGRRIRRSNKKAKNKRNVKRYNRKARNARRNSKRHAKGQRIYKARFKRSNNKRALKRSGFFNAYPDGGHFIFNKYAPNDKRAVVSKDADTSEWFQGKFGVKGKYLTVYNYNNQKHGWILTHKGQPMSKNRAPKNKTHRAYRKA